MKNLTLYCYHMFALTLLLASYSCKRDTADVGGVTDRIPENVRLSDYSNSSITVTWDRVEGATSYTVHLLGAKEGESPIDAYTTVSRDFYQFNGLEELRGYYVRVRANVDYAVGDWGYIVDGQEPARIMPKYGIVDEDFVEPEPEPEPELRLYPNFPEGWEVHPDEANRKRAYAGDSDTYPSGRWLMPNMYAHNVGTLVHKVGTWAVMMNTNVATYLEMDFDLPYGAAKFSFYYGAATITNNNEVLGLPILIKVEYSQDSGNTWIPLGDDLVVDDINEQYFKEYDELDIQGPVRFRIGKNNSRGRPIIDEIAVYYLD